MKQLLDEKNPLRPGNALPLPIINIVHTVMGKSEGISTLPESRSLPQPTKLGLYYNPLIFPSF